MAFIEVHGMAMAENSYIENLVVESLSSDPTAVEAGRIWFNTTEKKYKATSLDDGGAVVIKVLGSEEELLAFIAELADQTDGHGAKNVGYDGHNGANGQFSVAAGTVDVTLDSVVDGIDANKQALADLGSGTLTDLQNEIDAVEAGAGLGTDGSYTADTSANYINTATTLADADSKLDAQVKVNADAITQEQADRAAADALKVNKAGDSMTGNLSMSGNRITNVATPVDDNDAVNKVYVDTAVQGMDWKNSVRVASNTNVDIATGGLLTIDDVTLVEGDRVLLLGQTNAAENGIYVASENAWVRSEDADGNPDSEVTNGLAVFVEEGTNFGGNGYVLTTPNPIDLGTTELSFSQFNGAGKIIAGEGISKNGNTLYINFGAGIADLPNDEVGVDVLPTGSLFNTVDGVTESTASEAQLSIKLDGDTLTTSANGLKISDSVLSSLNDSDAALQNEIDAVEAGAGLGTDGSYVADTNANYIASATTLADADSKLDAQAKANADAIAQEVSDRTAADSAIQTEVDAIETGAGLGTDGSYAANTNANYINGATSLKNADDLLDTQVKANADAIAQEVSDRTTAISDLKTSINANTYTFESSTAATSFTISHNLGSAFVTTALWIKQDDGTFTNDLAQITLNDNNTLTVDLTVAKNIRVIVTAPTDV